MNKLVLALSLLAFPAMAGDVVVSKLGQNSNDQRCLIQKNGAESDRGPAQLRSELISLEKPKRSVGESQARDAQ